MVLLQCHRAPLKRAVTTSKLMESHYNHNCMTILVQQQTCNMPNAVKMLVVQDHTKTTLCVCLFVRYIYGKSEFAFVPITLSARTERCHGKAKKKENKNLNGRSKGNKKQISSAQITERK